MTRVAASHIRVGTFQLLASRGEQDKVRRLADYVIERHYPELQGRADPYLELLASVCDRQAALIASWMHVGFIHGVMNTDNMAISGETIDYGPCAFMDHYDPATVFSSIDTQGRYAYANQPRIAQWNLARLAETLLPLIDADENRAIARATEVVNAFPEHYQRHWLKGMRAKLGLVSEEEADLNLAAGFLTAMEGKKVDYTLAFRYLADAALDHDESIRSLFADPSAYDLWSGHWRARLARETVAPLDAGAGDAPRQSRVHPAQSPRRGSLGRRSRSRRLRAFRNSAAYPGVSFRRSARVCRLCRTCQPKGERATKPFEALESRVRATQNCEIQNL